MYINVYGRIKDPSGTAPHPHPHRPRGGKVLLLESRQRWVRGERSSPENLCSAAIKRVDKASLSKQRGGGRCFLQLAFISTRERLQRHDSNSSQRTASTFSKVAATEVLHQDERNGMKQLTFGNLFIFCPDLYISSQVPESSTISPLFAAFCEKKKEGQHVWFLRLLCF